MRRCVWSRNLRNEEALARVRPQRHREKNVLGDYLKKYEEKKNIVGRSVILLRNL